MTWPVIADGALFVGLSRFNSTETRIISIDINSGDIRWEVSQDEPITAPAIIDDSLVFGGSGLTARDWSDGEELWTYNPESKWATTPVNSGDTVYSSSNGSIFAMDVTDQTQVWTNDRDSRVSSTVGLYDGTVFAGSAGKNHELVAIGSHDGGVKWSTQTEQGIKTTPAISNDSVYASGNSGAIYSVDRSNGDIEWTISPDGNTRHPASSPAIGKDSVYVHSENTVYAMDSSNGDVIWEKRFKSNVPYPIIATPSNVALISKNTIEILKSKDGAEQNSFDLPEGSQLSGLAVLDGRAYVGALMDDEFRIYSFVG